MPKKVLFVCTGNFDRSPTAENMYKGIAGLEVKSAGISVVAQEPLSKWLVEWADIIYAMEELHKKSHCETRLLSQKQDNGPRYPRHLS